MAGAHVFGPTGRGSVYPGRTPGDTDDPRSRPSRAALAALTPAAPAALASAYSGRPGCACGCRGNYRYASAHREWAGRNRGYAVGDDDVSDRSVARINARAAADAGWTVEAYADDDGRVTTVAVETDSRLYLLTPAPVA